MHYHVMTSDRLDLRRTYSLAECDEFAREHGPGTYDVVAVSRRLGRDHEAWPWGRIVLGRDGTIERIPAA